MNTIIKYPNHYIVNAQRHIHVLIIYHLNAASYKPFLQPFHNNFACSNHYLLSKKTYCKFLSKKPRHFFLNNCNRSRLTHHRLSLPPSMHLGYPNSVRLRLLNVFLLVCGRYGYLIALVLSLRTCGVASLFLQVHGR